MHLPKVLYAKFAGYNLVAEGGHNERLVAGGQVLVAQIDWSSIRDSRRKKSKIDSYWATRINFSINNSELESNRIEIVKRHKNSFKFLNLKLSNFNLNYFDISIRNSIFNIVKKIFNF